MSANLLQTPIDYLKGVGPNRADLLRKELGIHTYQDLINFFPNRYIDKTRYYKINELQQNTSEIQLTGKIELVWFRGQKWIRENLKINVPYVIFGKANWFNGMFSMPHPEMELLEEHENTLRTAMQPVYPSTERLTKAGVTNRVVNKLMQQLFIEAGGKFYDTLPENIKTDLKLISR